MSATRRVRAIERLRAAGCVFAEREFEALDAESASANEFEALLTRRLDGEPLEWVVGWREFCGQRVPVHRGVFVPRARTEFLAESAAARLRPDDVVLDLGCGSGAIALVLATTRFPRWTVACDIDPRAVANARRTLSGWPAIVVQSDLFDGVESSQQFDLIVANLPYVPTAAIRHMPREARDCEPRTCLDGGIDGLDPLRHTALALPDRLRPGGCFLVEVSSTQGPAARSILTGVGLTVEIDDRDGDGCVLSAIRPVRGPGPAAVRFADPAAAVRFRSR